MRSLKVPPPFYDTLQTVTYCLMLGCRAGDLVQCVRAAAGGSSAGSRTGAASGTGRSFWKRTARLTGAGIPVPAAPTIHVTRVELDESCVSHREMWHTVVLPRLHAFAAAVHRLRTCSRARYALLCAPPERREAIVRHECPTLFG